MQMHIGQPNLPEPACLAIITASAAEAAHVRQRLVIKDKITQALGTLWHGRCRAQDVVLLRCGIGPERAVSGLRWLYGHYRLWGVLNVGFAGSLQPRIATGDAVWVTHVDTVATYAVRNDPDLKPDRTLSSLVAAAASRAGLMWHCGLLLSSDKLVSQAPTKRQLGEQSGALAVDMESYSLGREAARLLLPFAIMRTIFDTCHDDLRFPVDRCLSADGRLRYRSLAAYIALHPRMLLGLPDLAHKARLAGKHLDTWLDRFFAILDQQTTCLQRHTLVPRRRDIEPDIDLQADEP